MRLRVVTLLAVASVAVNCSSDSIAAPGHADSSTTRTLQLSSVSGAAIPAVYYVDGQNEWADSATVTLQPHGVIAFRIYVGTAPLPEAHPTLTDRFLFLSGELTTDSTFKVDYPNTTPDYGTINKDGSVTLNLIGADAGGNPVPFGRWVFAAPYGGPAFNPAPHIDSITPSSVVAASGDTTISLIGSNFIPTSEVSIGDYHVVASYVDAGRLSVAVPAAILSDAGTLQVLVSNPGRGGGTYQAPFFVHSTVPTITALTPNSVIAGSVSHVIIQVTGTGFDPSSTVLFNGVRHTPVRFQSSTRLDVPMDTPEISAARVIQLVVVNPPPDGGKSGSLVFTVTSQ